MEIVCEHCGTVTPQTTSIKRFCSVKCRNSAQRRRNSRVDRSPRDCVICGVLFIPEYKQGTPRQDYCSRRCAALGSMRRVRGIVAGPPDRRCWWCDAEFSDPDQRRKYCSAECRQLVKHLVDAPNLIDGWSATTYRDAWRTQDGKCKICRRPPSGRNNLLCRDHDHTTGQPRGLLCDSCNRAIGLLGDSLERVQNAADYLQHYHPELLRKGGAA